MHSPTREQTRTTSTDRRRPRTTSVPLLAAGAARPRPVCAAICKIFVSRHSGVRRTTGEATAHPPVDLDRPPPPATPHPSPRRSRTTGSRPAPATKPPKTAPTDGARPRSIREALRRGAGEPACSAPSPPGTNRPPPGNHPVEAGRPLPRLIAGSSPSVRPVRAERERRRRDARIGRAEPNGRAPPKDLGSFFRF